MLSTKHDSCSTSIAKESPAKRVSTGNVPTVSHRRHPNASGSPANDVDVPLVSRSRKLRDIKIVTVNTENEEYTFYMLLTNAVGI
jgi:hypothetical protein